jgi:transcriptional regulator with XRE-family HTH domain
MQEPSPLRRARARRELTQEQVADLLRQLGLERGHGELGVDANAVSRHERGVIGMPRPPYPQLYAELYGVGVDRLWPAATMGGMNRRTFLQAVAAASGGALLPAGDDLDAILQVTAGLRRLEATTPAGELRGPVLAHLRLVGARIDRDPRYAAAAAEVARLSAWLAWDQQDQQHARALYARAVRDALRSGQPALVAYMRGSWALWAAETGQGPQAVRIARQVPPAQLGPWLHAMRATVAASVRDTDATLASLRQADRAMTVPPPPGAAPFTPPKLAGYVGRSYKLLGLRKAAVPALREALAADPPDRHRASLLLDLADVLGPGNEEARQLRQDARRIGEQLGSRRLLAGAR